MTAEFGRSIAPFLGKGAVAPFSKRDLGSGPLFFRSFFYFQQKKLKPTIFEQMGVLYKLR